MRQCRARRGRSEQEGASETRCRSQRAGGRALLSVVVGLSEMEPGQGFEHGVNRFPPAAVG